MNECKFWNTLNFNQHLSVYPCSLCNHVTFIVTKLWLSFGFFVGYNRPYIDNQAHRMLDNFLVFFLSIFHDV